MRIIDSVTPEPRSRAEILITQIKEKFIRYAIFRGNKIGYLRWLGMKIGEGCEICTKVDGFSEPWLVEIGNRVTLTGGVLLLAHDGASRLFRNELPGSSKFGNRFGRIIIHDECFIGMNSIIMPDVEIGPYSIIGAGSLVNRNVPPRMVFAGVPAIGICTLDEYIVRYKEKMIEIMAKNRNELRRELTIRFWGEER